MESLNNIPAWAEIVMIVVGGVVAFLMLGQKLKSLLREFLDVQELMKQIAAVIDRLDKHEEKCEIDRKRTHEELARLATTMNGITTSQKESADSAHRARKELHEKLDTLAQRVARIEQQLNERT